MNSRKERGKLLNWQQCIVPSDAETEEYCLCEDVVNMASIVDIREEQLRSRRD